MRENKEVDTEEEQGKSGGQIEEVGDLSSKEIQQIHANGSSSSSSIFAKQENNNNDDGIHRDGGNAKASTSSSAISKEDLFLSRLTPVPKVLHINNKSDTLTQDSEEGDGGSSKIVVVDAEWGLGKERQPTGKVDEALFSKLSHFQTLKEQQGTHFNQSLAKNRSFRNPHIYNKLVQWVEVEETASGYSDMIKRKGTSDDVWMSSKEARARLRVQGGKDVIGE